MKPRLRFLLLLAAGCGHFQGAGRPLVSGRSGYEAKPCNGHEALVLPAGFNDRAFMRQGLSYYRCYD